MVSAEEEKIKKREKNGKKLQAVLSRGRTDANVAFSCATTEVPLTVMSSRTGSSSKDSISDEALRSLSNEDGYGGDRSIPEDHSPPLSVQSHSLYANRQLNISPNSVIDEFANFQSMHPSEAYEKPRCPLEDMNLSGLQPPPFRRRTIKNKPPTSYSTSISNASYRLGDVARYQDIVEFATRKESERAIRGLPVGSPVFTKRSNGDWTYAVLQRKEKGSKGDHSGDESVRVLVDRQKNVKVVNRRKWYSCLRLVRPDFDKHRQRCATAKKEQRPTLKKSSSFDSFHSVSHETSFNSTLLMLPPQSSTDTSGLRSSIRRIISSDSIALPAAPFAPHASPNLAAKHFYGSRRQRFSSQPQSIVRSRSLLYPTGYMPNLDDAHRLRGVEP